MIPFLVGILLNGIAFSKANDGYVTFGSVFGSCFKMAMIVTLVMVVWGFLSTWLSFPEMKCRNSAKHAAREEMMKKQNIDR